MGSVLVLHICGHFGIPPYGRTLRIEPARTALCLKRAIETVLLKMKWNLQAIFELHTHLTPFRIHTGGLGPCPSLWGGPPQLFSLVGARGWVYCLGVWIGSLNGAECLSQGLSIPAWGPCIQLRRPWEMMCALFWELNLCASLSVWDGPFEWRAVFGSGHSYFCPFQKIVDGYPSLSVIFASPLLCNNDQYPRTLYGLSHVFMYCIFRKYLLKTCACDINFNKMHCSTQHVHIWWDKTVVTLPEQFRANDFIYQHDLETSLIKTRWSVLKMLCSMCLQFPVKREVVRHDTRYSVTPPPFKIVNVYLSPQSEIECTMMSEIIQISGNERLFWFWVFWSVFGFGQCVEMLLDSCRNTFMGCVPRLTFFLSVCLSFSHWHQPPVDCEWENTWGLSHCQERRHVSLSAKLS